MPQPVTDILVRESGRFETDIRSRVFATDPWIHLTPRGDFPGAMGEVISNLTYGRSAPLTATDDWENIAVIDGQEGGACVPTAEEVEVGSLTRNFNLKRKALRGPRFCAEEARTVFALHDQLDKIAKLLANRTRLEWSKRNRMEYFRIAQYKAVCNARTDYTDTQAASYNGGVTADSVLTQGFLDFWKPRLIREGAGMTAMGKFNGAPVLSLVSSMETSDHIIRDGGDNQDDLRWGKPSELLREIGVERIYRGYHHIIDPYPRRFNLVEGAYVEVPQFAEDTSMTKGVSAKVNPDWETATFEESFIFDRGVYTQLVPKPVTAPHPKFRWDPVNYLGDWRILNIPHETENPLSNILFHYGVLASASKAEQPELGVAFLHLRCDAPLAKKNCAALEPA